MATKRKPTPPTEIMYADSANLDDFGVPRMSSRVGIFENKFLFSGKHEAWETRITGARIVFSGASGPGFLVEQTITQGTYPNEVSGTITEVGADYLVYTTRNNAFTDGQPITNGLGTPTTATVVSHNTGADMWHDPTTASMKLKVGTASGEKVIHQSHEYLQYVGGYGHAIKLTDTLAAPKAGLWQAVIYGDDDNGLGFGYNGLDPFILVYNDVGGVPFYKEYLSHEWTVNKGDGNGPYLRGIADDFVYDPTKSQIHGISFAWLGVGRARFSLNIDGIERYLHYETHANQESGVFLRTPNLPLRYIIRNDAPTASDSVLEQICQSVSSEGGYIIVGNEYVVGLRLTQSRPLSGALSPLFAVRLSNTIYGGQPNRLNLRLLGISGTALTNHASFILTHVHDPLTPTTGWSQAVSTKGTPIEGVEINTTLTTFTGRHVHDIVAFDVFAGVGQGGSSVPIRVDHLNNHNRLFQNFESNNSDWFVLSVEAITGTTNASGYLTFAKGGE